MIAASSRYHRASSISPAASARFKRSSNGQAPFLASSIGVSSAGGSAIPRSYLGRLWHPIPFLGHHAPCGIDDLAGVAGVVPDVGPGGEEVGRRPVERSGIAGPAVDVDRRAGRQDEAAGERVALAPA